MRAGVDVNNEVDEEHAIAVHIDPKTSATGDVPADVAAVTPSRLPTARKPSSYSAESRMNCLVLAGDLPKLLSALPAEPPDTAVAAPERPKTLAGKFRPRRRGRR